MATKSQIKLQLIIESSATVAKSSQIKAMYGDHFDNANDESSSNAPIASTIDTDDDDGDGDGSASTTHVHLQLIISHGNIFHPQSKLTIVLPSVLKNKMKQKRVHQIKIGENNLFEEESHLILSLPLSSFQPNSNDEHEDENEIITVVGSYNQFAPKCQIYTNGTTIGNGNIFHSFSTLHLKHNELIVGNGNIFNSFVSIGTKGGNDERGSDSYQIESSSGGRRSYFQNQVFFMLSSASSASASASVSSSSSKRPMKLMQRTNENGVRKNMVDVTLLLSATKKILQMNHALMSSTKVDQ